VYKIRGMARESITPFADQGRRLRWLRQAEGFTSGVAFAAFMRWQQSGYSQFETGRRRVPADKAMQLRDRIHGFDPVWLWTGDKRGLTSFDLRQRIEAEEAKEQSADCERQDVGG
jgi:helix-turn-helix protein